MPWGAIIGGTIAAGASLYNGLMNRRENSSANNQNYNAQKEFYQNSVSWRTQDARRAGINPLYALGADSANFSPSFRSADDNSIANAGTSIQQGLQQYYYAKGLEDNAKQTESQIALLEAQKLKTDAETQAIYYDINNANKTNADNSVKSKPVNRNFSLNQLTYDTFTPIKNTGFAAMRTGEKSFVVSWRNPEMRQAQFDGDTEKGLMSALTDMGLSFVGARVYNDKVKLADGSVFEVRQIKSSGSPGWHFYAVNEKAEKKVEKKPIDKNKLNEALSKGSGAVNSIGYY